MPLRCLNNLLANSKYSTQTNKLFDNLAFPPGLYIQAHIIEKPIYICNNNNLHLRFCLQFAKQELWSGGVLRTRLIYQQFLFSLWNISAILS